MKKQICVVIFLSLFFAVFAQQSSVKTTTTDNSIKWEYMIVCFGKTLFGDSEKTLLYFGAEELPSEGKEVQSKLDILGKHGWEVIEIVGSIGGDQQVVLKRIYNQKITDAENVKIEELKKELMDKYIRDYEIYLKEQEALALKEKEKGSQIEAAAEKKEVLIDRDELDTWAIQKQKYQEQEEEATRIQVAAEKYINTVFNEYTASFMSDKKLNLTENKYNFQIVFDLTKTFLQNTNQYRKSEVDKFVRDRLGEINIDRDLLGRNAIVISIEAFITYKNERVVIGTSERTYRFTNPDK